MQADDWPRVRAIYEDGIGSGDATFETRAPDWREFDPATACRRVTWPCAAAGATWCCSSDAALWPARIEVAGDLPVVLTRIRCEPLC